MTATGPGASALSGLVGEADRDAFDRCLTRLRSAFLPLEDKPEETPAATLAALWHLAADRPLSATLAVASPLPALTARQQARLDALIAERTLGVPLAHMTGRQHFCGLELYADPAALIPRRETELLVTEALAVLGQRPAGAAAPLVIDVCTGCGNVALAIAAGASAARVLCADLSAEAGSLAQKNVEWLDLAGRVEVRVGNLLEPFPLAEFGGRVDVLTCNPPYISSRSLERLPTETGRHEPPMAFDGGPLGLSILQRLVREAPAYLAPGGSLIFEVGRGQGQLLVDRLRRAGTFEVVSGVRDAAGDIRVVAGRRNEIVGAE